MPQQYPFGSPNDKYKRKLFVETGAGFVEVKARVVEPYSSPAPQYKSKEIEVINAPSFLKQGGISSYKAVINLLFDNKEDYHDYLIFSGWTHKYYDEKGNIYLGTVDQIKADPKQAMTKYMVELTMTLIKKDAYDPKDTFQYQDLVDTDGSPHWAKADIEEMANLGLVSVMDIRGNPVLYFRPNDFVTRAEFTVFCMRTAKLIEKIVRE